MNSKSGITLLILGWFISVVFGYVNIFCVVFLFCMWRGCLLYENFYKGIIILLFLELLMPNSLGLYSSILLLLFLYIKLVDTFWKGASVQKLILETVTVIFLYLILKQLGYWLLYRNSISLAMSLDNVLLEAITILALTFIGWLFSKLRQKSNRIKI